MLSSYLGYYSLILTILFSVTLIFLCFKDLKLINIFINKNIFILTFLQFFTVFISFLSLISSFVLSDFSIQSVYQNSHTSKPLFYKISGTWGNHEGSLLLWLLVLTFFLLLFLLNSKNTPKKYRLLTLFFQEIIIIGFLIFILKTSNPFLFLFPVPTEGLGLNPILQDPALAIHPPILYLGYVGSSIVLSSCLAALTQNFISQRWATSIKKWILSSWVLLTLGIMLGSIWAYYELGWGGFWFWDPVENVSLMPWFCLTALMHSIIVLEKKSMLKSWTVILCIATFTLSMSGTFLVRSGILNSVHTFANDPERGVYILIFLFSLIFLSVIIFFLFQPENKKLPKNYILSREVSIIINNWFMMYFLSVVVIGTLYPIFLDVLNGEKISVGAPFYEKLLLPFLIPFLFFMAVGQNFKWIKTNLNNFNIELIIFFIISIIISFFLLKKIDSNYLINSVLVAGGLYLFFLTLKDLIYKKESFSKNIAHLGFSLLIVSIIFNNILSTEINTNIKIGEIYKFKNVEISFLKIDKKQEKNFKSVTGYFKIKKNENKSIYLKPEIRIYNQPITMTSEADIKSSIFSDEFLAMNLIKDSDYFSIRYQIKSFMIWIWISTLLIVCGGILRIFKRN